MYPSTGFQNKHALIIPTLINTQTAAAQRFFENSSPDEILKYSSSLWENIVNECEIAKPNQVILSAEGFWSRSLDDVESIRRKFSRICTTSEVVAYVRSPASRFLSQMNQRLRGFRSIPGISSNFYRNGISNFAESDFDQIRIRIFDSGMLVNGDIIDDFCSVFLPDLQELLERENLRSNETVSAEAMALFQQTVAPILLEGQDSPNAVRQNIRNLIKRADRELMGYQRPTLHKEVANAIVAKSHDLTWLRDEWGIVFPDVDYGLIGVEPRLNLQKLRKVSDFCLVNEDRLETLTAKVASRRKDSQE